MYYFLVILFLSLDGRFWYIVAILVFVAVIWMPIIIITNCCQSFKEPSLREGFYLYTSMADFFFCFWNVLEVYFALNHYTHMYKFLYYYVATAAAFLVQSYISFYRAEQE